MTADQINLSNSLKNNIKKNIPDFDYKKSLNIHDTQSFVPSILSYFEKNLWYDLQQVILGDNHKQLYESEVTRLIKDLSKNVYEKLRHSMYLYELLARRPDGDEFTLDWLENLPIYLR